MNRRSLFRRGEARLEEELEEHLRLLTEDFRRSGMSDTEAARAARRALGNTALVREAWREEEGLPMIEKLIQDLRYALRSARRSAGFTTACILTLALGIGSATTIFTLVNGVVLKPLAYREPGQLAYLREVVPALAHIYPTVPVNYQHFGFWKDHTQSFSSMAALRGTSATLTGAGAPEQLDGVEASAALFEVLGLHPATGSGFAPEDDKAPRNVVLITDGLWQRRFNRDPRILGRAISLDGISRTIIVFCRPRFIFRRRMISGPSRVSAAASSSSLPFAIPGRAGKAITISPYSRACAPASR